MEDIVMSNYTQFVRAQVALGDVENVEQIPLSYLDTDGTLLANSDTKVASQKAVKTYADAIIGEKDAMIYKGVIDCSGNPNYPAADAGHVYKVSVPGKIGGVAGINVETGDIVLCTNDGTVLGNQATVGLYWNVVQSNVDGAVIGPASSISGDLATFSGTGGKLIADSGYSASSFVAANSAITGATKTKVTYDAKGLVTAGADATTADIADSSDKRYCTDAQKTVIGNTSNTNTGDQTISITGDVTASGSTSALSATVTKINGTLLSGLSTGILKNTTTTGVPSIAVAGTDYLTPSGSGANLTGITATQVGLGNVTNVAQMPLSYLDTDGALAANSDSKVASQKAVKTYADALIGANDAMSYKGVIDCSGNPNYPAANSGDVYKVSVAGKIGGASGTNVEVGDLILCTHDASASGDQATVGVYWNAIQVNIDGAVSGPASSVSGNFSSFNGTGGKLLSDSGYSASSFVAVNSAITSATKTKITYDAKGLVTVGADATTADIADSADRRYCTDAQKTVIGNTSNTNTGDETASTIKTKLGITTLSGSNTGDQTISITGDVTASGSTGVLTASVTKINGTSLAGLTTGLLKNTTTTGVPSIAVAGTDYLVPTGNGSGLTGITATQVGLGNVTNVAQMPLSYLDTDGSLSANSDTKVASQKAVKTYADTLINANDAMVYKGVINCSGNPDYPAADAGHMYKVSVAGKIGGASGVNVEVGDSILCTNDATSSGNQATVGSYWNIIQANIDGAVTGPASSVSGNFAAFSGTGGKVIADSSYSPSSFAGVSQTMYIGTTAHALNRASAAEGLSGITGLTPAANFTLTQNSVAAFTSIESGAVVNTLYLKTGRVGILTSNPGTALEVAGIGRFGSDFSTMPTPTYGGVMIGQYGAGATGELQFVTSASSSGFGFRFIGNSGDGSLRIERRSNSASWSDFMTFLPGGSLGVGTTNPLNDVNVHNATTNCRILISTAATNGVAALRYTNDAHTYSTRINASDYFQIRDVTADVARLTLDPSGHFGLLTETPTATLEVGGINTDSSNASAFRISTIINSSDTGTQYGFHNDAHFNPTGASLSFTYGISNVSLIGTSSTPVTNATAIYSRIDTVAGYTGTIAAARAFYAGAPVVNGPNPITNYYHMYGSSITNGNGVTSGTISNYGMYIGTHTAAASTGGTVTNYGIRVQVPSGAGAGTTNNYGLAIMGTGGGTDALYSLFNYSTAPSYFNNRVGIGTGSANAPLHVSSSPVDTGIHGAQIGFDPSVTTSGTYINYALLIDANKKVASGVSDGGRIYGIYMNAMRNYGSTGDSGTVAVVAGASLQFGHYNSDSATPTTTTVYGLYTVGQAQTGSIGTMYNLYTASAGSATVTTGYGLYIGTILGTTNYAIYQATASNDNYFAGDTGIGTPSPGSKLDVKGTLRLSGATSGYVGFAPASAAGATTYTLPSADGSDGYVLTTNGAGALAWEQAPSALPPAWSSVLKSSNYVITDLDGYNTIFISGNTTITLPDAGTRRRISFAKTDTGTVATVSRAGTDTIQGATTITLNSQYGTVTLESDGTSTWYEF
jgi:hypothetical protein